MNVSDYLTDVVKTKYILVYCITFAFANFTRLLFPEDISNLPFLIVIILGVLLLLQVNPLSNYISEFSQMYGTFLPEDSMRMVSFFIYGLVFLGAFVGIKRGENRILRYFQYFLVLNLIMLVVPLALLYSGIYPTTEFISIDIVTIIILLLGIYLVRSVDLNLTSTESRHSASNETSREITDTQNTHPDESSEDTTGGDVSSQQASHGVSGDSDGTTDRNPSTGSKSDPIGGRLSNLSTIEKSILGGAFLAIIGTVLPWRTASALGTSFSVSLFDIGSGVDALLIILMSLVVTSLVIIGDSTKSLIASAIPAVLVFIICISYLTGSNMGNPEASALIQTGLGTYLSSLGSVLMTGGVLYEIYTRIS